MKKVALLVFVSFVLSFVGCAPAADVGSFVTELDSVTAEVVKKISSNDVAGAKTYFDGKKAGLASSIAVLKKIPDGQMPKADEDKLVASVDKNLKALQDAIDSRKRNDTGATDTAEKAKALVNANTTDQIERDFKGLFKD